MLGLYDNFPQTVHNAKHVACSIPSKKLQQTLIKTLLKLNEETANTENITEPSMSGCNVKLEFGIAQANNFNYLDIEESNKLLEAINERIFRNMDFLCVLRYYKTREKTPLRFDYYILRFIFDQTLMEIKVFHERGPRHTAPEDLANFIINKTNEESKKKVLRTIDVY